MSRFMLIVGGADLDKRSGNPAFRPAMLEQYMAWVQRLENQGNMVTRAKLRDQIGRRLTVRGGDVMDGPFIESKDAIGGFFIVDAESLDEATELARACPALHLQRGYVEIRIVEASSFDGTG